MVEVHSTKKFVNLPCAHAQWFHLNKDGSPGHCASIHGYDRSVELTFSGQIDEHGWIVPFGGLKVVKEFLEYYFDHTTILGADDPRVTDNIDSSLLRELRLLPSGVSMEMSSLFIWQFVSPFIYQMTDTRCYVSKVECREHERNSGFVTATREDTVRQHTHMLGCELLPKHDMWRFEPPKDALNRLNKVVKLNEEASVTTKIG